jgi:hypothetical protein
MMCLYFLPCFLRQTRRRYHLSAESPRYLHMHGSEACPFPIVVAHVSDSSERMSQVASTGERLYRTEDGGRDFRAFPLPEEASSEGFLHMDFVSPTLGWAISVVRQTKQFLLLQTTNGGQNWTVLAPTVG